MSHISSKSELIFPNSKNAQFSLDKCVISTKSSRVDQSLNSVEVFATVTVLKMKRWTIDELNSDLVNNLDHGYMRLTTSSSSKDLKHSYKSS